MNMSVYIKHSLKKKLNCNDVFASKPILCTQSRFQD